MTINTERYQDQIAILPQNGQQIIAQYNQDHIIVYQAFNANIANDAVEMQGFGGKHYSFDRMTWIKPNFLWMMYRAGWGKKTNQERILAITVKMKGFYTILSQALHAKYKSNLYESRAEWQAAMSRSEVRLQWDPDHDPYGNKLQRRAIQLGLKGEILQEFSTKWIIRIEDISDFVYAEKARLDKEGPENLMVPIERTLDLNRPEIERSIGIRR